MFGEIQDLAAATIFKIHKWVYLGHLLTNLHQISSADTYYPYDDFWGLNSTRKFKMALGILVIRPSLVP